MNIVPVSIFCIIVAKLVTHLYPESHNYKIFSADNQCRCFKFTTITDTYVCLFCVVQYEGQKYHLIKSHRVKYISGFAFIECTIVWISLIPFHEQMPKMNDWDPTNVRLLLHTDLTVVSVAFQEILDEQFSKQ